MGPVSDDPGTSGVVVTPEAVPLDFEAAHIGSRFVALAIDLVVMASMLLILLMAAGLLAGAGAFDGLPPAAGVAAILLLVFGVVWGYPVGLETVLRGRTPGKAAMGLRVLTVEGGPIGFRHAAIRAALGLVDFGLTSGFAAVVSAVATRRHQRLGDLVAGTVVVVERSATGPPTAVQFAVPPGAEAYAATLDVAGLRRDDYAAVRAFLLRADDLDPGARREVAEAIATSLSQRLPARPATDVSAELFLRCVAARFQQSAARVPAPWDGESGEPGDPRPARVDTVPPEPSRRGFAPPA